VAEQTAAAFSASVAQLCLSMSSATGALPDERRMHPHDQYKAAPPMNKQKNRV